MAKERGMCIIPGCEHLQRNKGRSRLSGEHIWDMYCDMHHRLRCSTEHKAERIRRQKAFYNRVPVIPNDKCVRCGWKEGPCDRHRLDPSLSYDPSNVVSLCPNCHRLVSMGLIEL